jgi:hypothetical protein
MAEDEKRYCMASALVEALRKAIDEHGDLPVCLDDPDTGWQMEIGLELAEVTEYEPDEPRRLQITSAYNGIPDGYIK